jgi:hypothetical protein
MKTDMRSRAREWGSGSVSVVRIASRRFRSSFGRQPHHRKCCRSATKSGRVGRRAVATIARKCCPWATKSCQVSESFGSSSVARLRTPPTSFSLAPACERARETSDFTDTDRRSIRPLTPPTHRLVRVPCNVYRLNAVLVVISLW